MEIRLYARAQKEYSSVIDESSYVATAITLPWQTPPGVLIWGSRAFRYVEAAKYVEVFAIVITETK